MVDELVRPEVDWKAIKHLPDDFYETLGEPKPGSKFGLLDDYRFQVVLRRLSPGSVLDVGAYFGDFLKLARQGGHEIAGTEINATRVKLANSMLGSDVVVEDSRNGGLSKFADGSFDNVVCTEVVEHQPDDRLAVAELCRVARRKVVITVPFRERARGMLCVHCSRYTPVSGHLHADYDLGSFQSLLPNGWTIFEETPFAKPLAARIVRFLPRTRAAGQILRLADALSRGTGRWLLVVMRPDQY